MIKAAETWKVEEHGICANISSSFSFYLKYIFYSFSKKGDWMKDKWVTEAEIIPRDHSDLFPS